MARKIIKSAKIVAGRIFYGISHMFVSQKSIMTNERADEILNNYYPKNAGKGCITLNKISDNPQYDLQIIIPCYNVEKYVEECLNSVLNQKTRYSFLVVVVDDGSTDSTGEILRKYENVTNVKIITQENGGHSAARNAGLKNIESKYIMFVDSDDYILPGCIENLMSAALRTGANIVEGGCYNLIDGRMEINVAHEEGIVPAQSLKGYPVLKTYKAELFSNVCFPNGLWFEDMINQFLIYWKAKSAYCINNMVYVYRQVATSITHTCTCNKKVIDTYYVTEQILQDAKKLSFNFGTDYLYLYLRQVLCNYTRLKRCPKNVREAIFIKESNLLSLFDKDVKVHKRHKQLFKCLTGKDFGRYELWCKTHR